ncbi:MAG: DUF3418 domain-containing protein, partial [bacterium]
QQEDNQWKEACTKWERDDLNSWDFENIPREILLNPADEAAPPRLAYPGLVAAKSFLLDNDSVSLRLFPTQQDAARATRKGLLALYALQYKADLKQLKKNWELPQQQVLKRFHQAFGDRQAFHEVLFTRILEGIFPVQDGLIPCKREFYGQLDEVRGKLALKGRRIMENIQDLLKDWQATMESIARFRRLASGNSLLNQLLQGLEAEVSRLLPPDFLTRYPMDRLAEIPRYLKGICVRAERAYAAPQKDQAKAQQLTEHQTRLKNVLETLDNGASPQRVEEIDEFRWMIEEFKISLFAPEIGTAYPVSAKRLEKKWQEIGGG